MYITKDQAQVLIDNDSGSQPGYIGYALPNATEQAKEWQIIKCIYTSGLLTGVKFADQDISFTKQWTQRSTYGASPYEDLTTYTEVDEFGDMTITPTTITVDTMSRNTVSYVYYDFGAAYFGGGLHYY